ncbi:MAG: hypothetical protein DME65_14235 [Verrucomicrobia bacterium]|nr:MAG: hypothetical protein DME65_14235 [Verrucomicrobiota bacterium]
MSEPPRRSNRLPELLALVGAPDEIEPVNRHVFARKLRQVIARASANMQGRYGWRRRPGGRKKTSTLRLCSLKAAAENF